MRFTKVTLEAGEIASRVVLDTDVMDAPRLASMGRLLATLRGQEGPVAVAGTGEEQIILGLGDRPIPPDIRAHLTDDQLEKLLAQRAEERPFRREREFWFGYRGHGPQFVLICEGDAEGAIPLDACIAGNFGRVHAEEFSKNRAAFPPKEVLKERFAAVARSIWEERPVMVCFDSWGAAWDEYAEYFAAAMMLRAAGERGG